MSSRISFQQTAPDGVRAMLGLERYLSGSDLEPNLRELIYFRASQINGCAVCLAMHSAALRAHGESERRLYLLDAWREAPDYSERERAALAWTEAVTRLPGGQVSDEVYEQGLRHFGARGLADLTLAVATINAWNRLNVAFQNSPAE